MGLLLSLVLPLIPIIILLVLVGVALDVILRDWMLPHYALEDTTAGEAWEEVWDRITAEKRQFAVYALLRLILPVIAMIGLFIVLLIPGLMVAGAVAAIVYAIHSAFADATGVSVLIGILLQVFFGVVAFGYALLAGICLGGPLSTGLREYALIFYGGRYQALGEMLYPAASAITGSWNIFGVVSVQYKRNTQWRIPGHGMRQSRSCGMMGWTGYGDGYGRIYAHSLPSPCCLRVARHPGRLFDLYGARLLCGSFGLIPRIGAAASLRSVGQAGSSRCRWLLSLGRMLHSRRGDCHAGS